MVNSPVKKAACIFGHDAEDVCEPAQLPARAKALSVTAYWAVRYLSLSGTQAGKRLGLGQAAVSRAVKRGQQLVRKH